ncbi:MAG: class I SAM-dependent methyltransferase [Planctomycetes bacterium]|nr:class I SAM-dependent methyltransferase [Planctomycetota bacterium]
MGLDQSGLASVPNPADNAHIHPTVMNYVNNREIAYGYDTTFAGHPLFELDCRYIERHLKTGGTILDLGCGTGRHLVYFGKLGHKVCGVDLSPHMLDEASANCLANNVDASLVLGDMISPPLNGERFDAVLMMFSTFGLIRGVENRQKLLENTKKLLKKDGRLIFHVHNRNFGASAVMEKYRQLRDGIKSYLGECEPGDMIMKNYRNIQDLYCHFFTMDEVREILHNCGYNLVELYPVNHDRTGPYIGKKPGERASGFLVTASVKTYLLPPEA